MLDDECRRCRGQLRHASYFLEPDVIMAPDGALTAVQFEIMEVVWNQGKNGATVVEIWHEISENRDVARTTVLNLVDRLERRRWLRRRQGRGVNRFIAALSRNKTASLLAGDFVDDFFGGSASDLVMNLLGSKRLEPDEVRRLQQLIESKASENKSRSVGKRKDQTDGS